MKRSLAKKAVIGIIIILLPVVITFLLVCNHNRVYLKRRVLDTLTVIAGAYDGQVYQFLEQSKRRAQDFASDGFIRTQLFRINRGQTSLIGGLCKHLVKNKIVLDETINTMHVLSAEGKVVASTNGGEIGRDFSNESFFIQGKEAVDVVETSARHTISPELAISAPIFTKDTHKTIGVIVNFIRISELDKLLSGRCYGELGAISWDKKKGAWKTLEIYVVNRDKLMITKSLFIKDAVLRQVVDTAPVRLGLMSNKEMAGFYKDYRGIGVVGVSMYIPSMRWVLLVEIDKTEVLAPIKNVLLSAAITGAVVLVMVGLLLVLFLKRVLKPLRRITDAVRDIARGNLDIVIPVKTNDEMGMLCESFNTMSMDIKARTAALVKSNEKLAEAQRIAQLGNWEWDVVKNELSWSDEIYRIFGLSSEEFGATYEVFLSYVHPDDREFVKKNVSDAIYGKKPYNIDHRILLKDGTERIVHEMAGVIFDDTGMVIRMVGTVQDITERRHKEEEVNLLQSLILAVGESGNLHDALVVTLEKVCNATGWIYGEAWVPHRDGKYLERDHTFYSKMDSLIKFSELSGEYRFSPGVGLPGRAWLTKQPVWIRDVTIDSNYPRAQIARDAGLKAGVAFPVLTNEEVVAVVIFYMFKPLERVERLIDLVSSATVHLGQVIKRKQTEEALRKSEEMLHSILDNTTGVVYVKDLWGRYTFINKRFEKLFHISKDEIKGKTDYDLWPAEMADKFRENDREIINTGTPLEFDEVAPHDDGPHSYISVKFPLFDTTGVVNAVCGISTDITERKRAEEALSESEARLRSILDNTPAVVYIKDKQGRYTFINRQFEKLFHIKNDEITGKTPYDCFPKEIADAHLANDRKVFESKVPMEFEEAAAHDDGQHAYISIKFPLFDFTGTVYAVCGISTDITRIKQEEEEKEKLKEQLYHSQRLESVGKLAGGIAHDFNNIITAIIGYGSLIQMEMKEGDPSGNHVQKILVSAERAGHLTQGLLAFSRKQVNNPKPVNLNEIIKVTEGILLRIIGEDVEFKTSLTDKDYLVMADIGQIEQILMNLATNARDAMPGGGLLTISTDVVELDNDFIKIHSYGEAEKCAVMAFSDTGVGMDEKTRERIFEPFFTTKEVGKGTGLGLAIVYGIVKQHNGYINVSSEPGKGTTFRIYLPVIKPVAEEIKPEILTVPVPIQGTETILIAEDEAEVRNLVNAVLEGAGYKTITAVDGEDAVKKFMKNRDKIQLLLFDVIMPGKSGKEAYNVIRKKRPGIKVLFTSGYSEDMVDKKIILKEGLNFISKPLSPTDLLRKVREILDK